MIRKNSTKVKEHEYAISAYHGNFGTNFCSYVVKSTEGEAIKRVISDITKKGAITIIKGR